MMESQLQQVLRSLCFNTGWKYSVFWKLKHRARMMLTCEDAYYDNQYSESKWSNELIASMHYGPYSHDPLGLIVAKMSYQVYSLGEGIVGQVAVSGKHSFILASKHAAESSLTSENYDGWQDQFSAGIKTIAVVAVIPHGVVQLGSTHEIVEDLKLVNHIRDIFSKLQDSLAGLVPLRIQSHTETQSLPDTCKGLFHEDQMNLWSQMFPSFGNSQLFPIPALSHNRAVNMIMEHGAECSVQGIGESETSISSSSGKNIRKQQKPETGDLCKTNCEVEQSENVSKVLSDNMKIVTSGHPSGMLAPPTLQEEDSHPIPFTFRAGYELYEALGPAFQKQNTLPDWKAEKDAPKMAPDVSEGMSKSTLLMANSGAEHLLDAVVAKISQNVDDINSFTSCHKTGNSPPTAEKILETCTSDAGTISSAGYSFDRETSRSLNSVTCGVQSLKTSSASNSSMGSESLGKQVKANRKRARTGESSRPRPRDRQLIQDRIKELRELVPNGSKCSIDSLLERTIKHMLFLQSTTKHAEKLNKCSASKLFDKNIGMQRFSCNEQGSSWAVEVGNNSKVCPIVVENINMNGQMLIEMLSEQSSQFLEIAEAIRSLGLTVLKGVSEECGEKTWICFVVEGRNNRTVHRMDVLWSLMQLLQPNITS